jgi:hypothetical protein
VAVANPLFDVAGLTAGSVGYPPWLYWLAMALGKSIVYTALTLVGQALVPLLFSASLGAARDALPYTCGRDAGWPSRSAISAS